MVGKKTAFNYLVTNDVLHYYTLIWLHGLGGNCSSYKEFFNKVKLPNLKTVCIQAANISVTAAGPRHKTGTNELYNIIMF